jgi:hypothetical protein
VHQHFVGQALEKATDLKRTKKGKLPPTFTEGLLLDEPQVGTETGMKKFPDYVLFKGEQIEVFEATLDTSFEKGRSKKPASSISHKRIQIAGNVVQLAQLYPDFPIIYNIRAHEKPLEDVRKELEAELWSLRRHLESINLKNPVQIIWRY